MVKNYYLFLLALLGPLFLYGQEVPARKGANMEGWYIGIESLRLFNSVLFTAYSDDDLKYQKLYDIEVISFYQGKSILRPTIRAGYIWFRNNTQKQRMVVSRGPYVKLGTDILISRQEDRNHALGVYGVLSYAKEDYNFVVGNKYFGNKEVLHEQAAWATALELRYTYTRKIGDKFNCQLGGYVSIFEGQKELKAYENLPGITHSLGVYLHFLYHVR